MHVYTYTRIVLVKIGLKSALVWGSQLSVGLSDLVVTGLRPPVAIGHNYT